MEKLREIEPSRRLGIMGGFSQGENLIGLCFRMRSRQWDTGDGDCCPAAEGGTAVPVPGVP